jgi:MFS transporter, CP family, cyanate transporter
VTSWPGWLLLAAVVLLAFNLRSAVVSVGALLADIRAGLHLTPTVAGVLTTLPVVCFAAFGAAASGWARRFGARNVLTVALSVVVVGQAVRAVVPWTAVFLLATTLALAGMAVGNVVLPAFVKEYFPRRVGLATAAYTTSMAAGTAIPAALTVPLAATLGGWRAGLGVWAVTAAVALVGWLLVFGNVRGRRDSRRTNGTSRGFADLRHSPLAWSLALYFGLQSLQAYAAFGWLAQIFRDSGVSAATAGLLLSILPLMGIPLSLAFPTIAARLHDQRVLVWACGVAFLVGYAGLLLAPRAGAPVWAVLLGLGGGAFPLTLTMIGLRSRSYDVTGPLSAFTQSIGYVIAAVGPLALGALFEVTGGWTVPIGFLLVLVLPQMAAGLLAARRRFVDDELPHRPASGTDGAADSER